MTAHHTQRTSPLTSSTSIIQELEDDITRIDRGIQTLQRKTKLRNWWPLKHILKEPLHHGATLNRLCEERQLLSQALYSHTASHFILQDFPFELWELIFYYSVPNYSPHDPFHHLCPPSTRQAPLSLSHVNRQWRARVHDMPMLWTRLKIQNSRYSGQMGFVLDAVKGWLSRSNQRPITISISILAGRQTEATQCGLMDLIWNNSHRFQHLQLDLDSAEAVCQTLDRPMPCLQTLAYTQWGIWPSVPIISPENVPVLRDFRSGERLKNPCELVLPWANLTKLRSAYWGTVEDALQLLRATPNLESCSLAISERNDLITSAGATKDVHVASLKSLELRSTSMERMGLVLDHLFLPKLRALRLYGKIDAWHYPPSNWSWPKEALCHLVERQAAMPGNRMKLTKLALKGALAFRFREDDVREVAASIPSLEVIDTREALRGTESREYMYFPDVQQDAENWHGVLVKL